MNVEKILRKSSMTNCFSKISNEKIKAEILNLFSKMLEEIQLGNKVIYKHSAYSIFPAIAVYKVLLQYEGKDIAYRKLEECILNNAKKQKKFLKSLTILPGFFKLFGKMCKVGVATNFGSPAFDMIWEENSDKFIKWTCTSCIYHNELTRYGVGELTRIFCKADDVMYGNLKGASWARTKTIGNGDELCNFKFISNNVDVG